MTTPREKIKQLREHGHSLQAIADATGTTVAIVRKIVGTTDGGKAKLKEQEATARRIEAEGGTWTEKVKKWKKATGKSEATFWRVLRRAGKSMQGS